MIAVDALGGDFAPHAVLEGALRASRTRIPVAIFGPAEKISAILDQLDATWKTLPITLVSTTEEIGMAEEPAMAVRRKRDSSLVRAVAAVADGTCSAVISAGNSGALMVAAMFILGKHEGIERPAIAGILPVSGDRSVVVLDLGGNTDCKASHLVHFAQLGVDYARSMSIGGHSPRVGLLCNGTEEGKGSILVKEVHQILKQSSHDFVGNLEPLDVLSGRTDVVVCDGFTGNIFLKTIEASGQLFEKAATTFSVPGGAQLLGVRGTVIVAHGNSNAASIQKAIQLAHQI